MMKLAAPVLVLSIALVAACTAEEDKRAGAKTGTGGTSASGGSGGASSGGASGSGSGGATGSGGSASGTGGSGSGTGGGSGSGGSGSGSGSGGSSGRDSGGGSEAGAPDTGSSNPGAAVFKNTCEYPVMSGFMPSEFCPAYAEICTFTGTGRYTSLADCMAKFKGGASDGDACKAGHLCRAYKAPSMKEADCASSGTAACRN